MTDGGAIGPRGRPVNEPATENTETVLSLAWATARSRPEGLNATETGLRPVANGEPVAGLSVPPAPTENTDTVLS